MAKTISSLNVILGGTAAPLVGALHHAGEAMEGVKEKGHELGSELLKFTGIGAAIGTILGGVGFAELFHSQNEAIDSSAKLSDRLGITTEALSGLQYAASLSGVSTDSLTGGLQKYLKNVAGAAAGSGKLTAAFTSIGLNAKDLINLPTDQAIGKIGDALNAIKNPAQRAAAAQAIFGKTGQSLLPFLTKGADGIGELTDEADKLGLTFNRVDAAKVEASNEAIIKTGDVAVGIMRQIVVAAAPFIVKASDAFVSFGIRAVAAVKAAVPPIVGFMHQLGSIVVPVVVGIGNAIWNAVTSVWGAIWGFLSPIVSAISDFITANWQSILTAVVSVGVSVYSAVTSVFQGVWSIITTIGSGIAAAWNGAMNLLGLSTMAAGITTTSVVNNIGAAWLWFENAVSTVFTAAGFVIKNFVSILELAMTEGVLSMVTFGNQVAYVFTTVAPALLTWFGQNWRNVFTDIVSFTGIVLANIGKNLWSFLKAIGSWLSGDGFNFEFTGLTNGFQKTMSDLPAIAEREAGPLEQALGDQVAGMKEKLAIGFSDAFTANKSATEGITKSITDSVNGAFKGPDITAPTIAPPAVPVPEFDIDTTKADDKLAKTGAKAKGMAATVGNIEFGSAESMQRIALATAEATAAPVPDSTVKAMSDSAPEPTKPAGSGYDPSSNDVPSLLRQILAVLRQGNGAGVELIEAGDE